MKRLRLRTLLLKRTRHCLLVSFVLAATALCWGARVSCAAQGPVVAKPDPFAAKRAADAKRARAQRDAAVKKRQEGRKYLKQVIEGQHSATAPPVDDGKGGAK
jgi:hypothetical protein